MVPQSLLAHAGLTKEVIVIGNNDHLELWDPQAWQQYESDLTANLEGTVASIGRPAKRSLTAPLVEAVTRGCSPIASAPMVL
jgi:hypothetical protein